MLADFPIPYIPPPCASIDDEKGETRGLDTIRTVISTGEGKLEMTTPVPVLRLPKGPDPNSRGFDPKSPRFIALCRTSLPTAAGASEVDNEQLQTEQAARSVLRERFLRCLLAMTNKKVRFHMHEGVKVEATFGASDIDVLNFQVSDLHTPIGVQKEAVIRCQDVVSFTFDV